MTVFGGWSTLNSDDIDSDGWCGGARLLSHRGDWLQIGAEAGIFNVNGGMYELVGALKPTVTVGSFSPHGIFDIGWHNWTEGPSVLGAGAGGGIEWSPVPGGPAWGLESRYHWTLQNEDEPGNMSFAHVAVTARFNW
jgi:hypothetical protein